MATVYIETTIPSYYYSARKSAQAIAWRAATRRWWAESRPLHRCVTSEFVFSELRRTPGPDATAAMALLDGVPVLEHTRRTREVAQHYIDQMLMPRGATGDAAHLALASVHGIDFVLTWNCEHLANANKTPHLRTLNARLKLPVPTLTTPYELMPEPGR
jgi:hypothetical protein